MTSAVRQCPACGLPVFSGSYAYAGDICKCHWKPNDDHKRIVELELQVSYLMRRIEEIAKEPPNHCAELLRSGMLNV